MAGRYARSVGGVARTAAGTPRTASPLLESDDGTLPIGDETHPHEAFPSMARLANGDLLLAYRAGNNHGGSTQDLGYVAMRKSTDDGASWGNPWIAIQHPEEDERDPCISVLSDGTVTLQNHRVTVTPGETSYTVTGVRFYTSTDDGASWSEPNTVTVTPFRATSGSVVERGDGSLLSPVYRGGHETPAVFRSTDDGATWSLFAEYPSAAQEPFLLEGLSAGHWVTTFRNGYVSKSSDDGATWSALAQPLTSTNVSPAFRSSRTGNILFGVRQSSVLHGTPVTVQYSTDDAESVSFGAKLEYTAGEKFFAVEIGPGLWRAVYGSGGRLHSSLVWEPGAR